jgi:twitching motility protein PilJ
MSSGSSQSKPAPDHPGSASLRAIARRIAWHPWRLILPAILFALAMGSYLLQERLARGDVEFLAGLDRHALVALEILPAVARGVNDPDAPISPVRARERQARAMLEVLYPARTPLGLWSAPASVEARLAEIDARWQRLDQALQVLEARRSARDRLDQALIRFQAVATRMLITTDELVVAMAAAEEPPEQLRVAARQLVLIQRMVTNAERLLNGGKGRLTAADRFGRDAVLFGAVNNGLLGGNGELGIASVKSEAARELLAQTGRQFREASERVRTIVKQSVELTRLEEAVITTVRMGEGIIAAVRELQSEYRGYVATRPLAPEHTRILAGLAMVSLLLAALLMGADARAHRLSELQRHDDDRVREQRLEQAAVLAGADLRQVGEELARLMSDLGRIVEVETMPARGEDPGEALARGLRRVLGEVHSRVDAIVTSAHQVSTGASSLREAAEKLHAAGRQQAQHVDKAAGVTQELASAVKLGYTQFGKLDSLTESAVAEARTVQEQIGGATRELEALGTSVQETARRVRRLLERAHEARSVALRIDELSDHSKMLSLNVAIQTSPEARTTQSNASFADELQRLAERAREVVQSVERMREGLRADAEEAVKAIKHTAWSVKATGERLHKAERPIANLAQLSRKLEKFSQALVGSSQDHTLRATEVVRAVTAVHTVTAQSSVGAEAAASSAARLTELVLGLQAHVSRLHPVPVDKPSVVPLETERRSDADDEAESKTGKRGERRKGRAAGLRPVS